MGSLGSFCLRVSTHMGVKGVKIDSERLTQIVGKPFEVSERPFNVTVRPFEVSEKPFEVSERPF